MQLLRNLRSISFPAYHYESSGRVIATRGPLILARLPQAAIGDICFINTQNSVKLLAQVIAFENQLISLAPLDGLEGVSPGAIVHNTARPFLLEIPEDPKGYVLDACGAVMQGKRNHALPKKTLRLCVEAASPSSLERQPIREILSTGIRSIDSLLSIGIGQRVGLFAPAGVGKSTLLGMIARNASADLCVIALVGERGREVQALIQDVLGRDGMKQSVLVVSTSDESALRRALAPKTATAIAEHFRNQGKHVLLLVDSLTRTARALREIGLAQGEIPIKQGFTPSVYTELPKLLERSGTSREGSITAIYSVLIGNEEESDPLAEEISSLLDGHIIMTNNISRLGIRPAIDVVESNSRLFGALHCSQYQEQRDLICKLLARLKKDKELVLLGGSPDKELSVALQMEEDLKEFLSQDCRDSELLSESIQKLQKIAGRASEILKEKE